jgi:hypothetical protein
VPTHDAPKSNLKSQYHNAVACGSAVPNIGSSVNDIAATHTLPRCGTDFLATESRKALSEKTRTQELAVQRNAEGAQRGFV